MQPATSKGLFPFGFSSRAFWRMAQRQGGGWGAGRGVCASSRRALGLLTSGPCLCTGLFLRLCRPAWRWQSFPSSFPGEMWGFPVAGQVGHSCISMGRSPHGPHEILVKSQHHQQPWHKHLCLHLLCLFSASSLSDLCAQFCVQFVLPHHKP